jgi:two-component system nitrogen regulation response regulator GlnG
VESRVLIVDDEPTLRACLARYLEGCGASVAQAGSLAEARALLAARGFDALIVDVGLPDGDGLDLLDAAGSRRALVISAQPEPARYERRGVLHHLSKPLDLSTVLERLTQICAAA